MPAKRVQLQIDWVALEVLGRLRDLSLQQLADEAFLDLLEKYHRRSRRKEALRESVARPSPYPRRNRKNRGTRH